MPEKLVEFFVKFLTKKNGLVLDPFGGSNTTGKVSQDLGRRWVYIEQNKDYVLGSKGRFRSK
jgi:site-specific DNA-methyltransferase (cytosine-N4-specific)